MSQYCEGAGWPFFGLGTKIGAVELISIIILGGSLNYLPNKIFQIGLQGSNYKKQPTREQQE
jgi:hypothetical protein